MLDYTFAVIKILLVGKVMLEGKRMIVTGGAGVLGSSLAAVAQKQGACGKRGRSRAPFSMA